MNIWHRSRFLYVYVIHSYFYKIVSYALLSYVRVETDKLLQVSTELCVWLFKQNYESIFIELLVNEDYCSINIYI